MIDRRQFGAGAAALALMGLAKRGGAQVVGGIPP